MMIRWQMSSIRLLCVSVFIILLAAGCTKNNTEQVADSNEAVHLTLYMSNTKSNEWIQQYMITPMQQKFPHYTMDIIRRGEGTSPADLIAAGSFPDMFYEATPWLNEFQDLNLLFDLRELIKKHHFDLKKIDQAALEAILQWGEQGEIYGFPLWKNFSALYYNKDIFDKFAIAYPKDDMSWEEAIELSRQIARTEDGVIYKGIYPSGITDVTSQLSLSFVDERSLTSMLDTDGYKKVVQMFRNISLIPGHGVEHWTGGALEDFIKHKTLAMWVFYADVPQWLVDQAALGNVMNWDIATIPYFNEAPGLGFQVDSHNIHISASSPNKDAAFLAMSHWLSQEPQILLTRDGVLPAIQDAKVIAEFGKNLPILQNKNLKAITQSKPAPKYQMTKYDLIVMHELNKAVNEVQSSGKDINTVLREANELANKAIQEKIASESK